jgi:hypothetical protein
MPLGKGLWGMTESFKKREGQESEGNRVEEQVTGMK